MFHKSTMRKFLEDRTALVRFGSHIGIPIFFTHRCSTRSLSFAHVIQLLHTQLSRTNFYYRLHDIKQIISGRFIYKYTAQQTQYAIQQLNNYEAKWQIQTLSDIFKIISIRWHRTETIEIDNEELDNHETKGTYLGLYINTHGLTQQIKNVKLWPRAPKLTIQIQRL